MWVKYDQDADVLYIDVRNSDRIDRTILTEDGYIIRYTRDEVGGITVLDASTRQPPIIPEDLKIEKQPKQVKIKTFGNNDKEK